MNYEVNSHYWKRYLGFIERCRYDHSGYVERHHIYPRSMFPHKAAETKNLIALSAREHFIAHWMLHKAFGGKMTNAFMYMKSSSSDNERYWKLNAKSYALLRASFAAIWSKAKRGKPMSLEARRKMSETRTGVPLSTAHRRAISDGNRGSKRSAETCQKISAAKVGITPNRVVTESYRALMQRPKARTNCFHCGKDVSVNLVNRWHNDNCKQLMAA